MGCQHGLEHFQVVGGLLLAVLSWGGFSFSEFTVALGAVLGGCMVTLLILGDGFRFGHYSNLIPLCGDEFSSFVSYLCVLSH